MPVVLPLAPRLALLLVLLVFVVDEALVKSRVLLSLRYVAPPSPASVCSATWGTTGKAG
jgi:hypothetical protein